MNKYIKRDFESRKKEFINNVLNTVENFLNDNIQNITMMVEHDFVIDKKQRIKNIRLYREVKK